MTTKQEQAEFVASCVPLFAAAEKALTDARKLVAALVPLMKQGHELDIAGSLQSSRMAADLRYATGVVAKAESIVFSIHSEGTELAQAKGVDVPQPLDSGGHR